MSEEKTSSFAEKYGKKNTASNTGNDSETSSGGGSSSFADKYQKKESATSAQSMNKHDATTKSKASLIYLVKGIDDNRNAWYYVLVERLKLSLFLKALNDDIIHLENYGIILESAYGDEPPKEVTDKLKLEYGIED